MAVIKTQRNMVAAYEPLPEDRFVLTYVLGQKYRFVQSARPINQYLAQVSWAVEMADKLERVVNVVPITKDEYLAMMRREADEVSANPTVRQYFNLMQDRVIALLETIRESEDLEDRSVAREILVDMGVAC